MSNDTQSSIPRWTLVPHLERNERKWPGLKGKILTEPTDPEELRNPLLREKLSWCCGDTPVRRTLSSRVDHLHKAHLVIYYYLFAVSIFNSRVISLDAVLKISVYSNCGNIPLFHRKVRYWNSDSKQVFTCYATNVNHTHETIETELCQTVNFPNISDIASISLPERPEQFYLHHHHQVQQLANCPFLLWQLDWRTSGLANHVTEVEFKLRFSRGWIWKWALWVKDAPMMHPLETRDKSWPECWKMRRLKIEMKLWTPLYGRQNVTKMEASANYTWVPKYHNTALRENLDI